MKNLLSVCAIITIAIQVIPSFGQRVDTIYKATAWTNTFMSSNTYGLTREGHIYTLGFVNHYAKNGTPLPVELTKMDLTAGVITYKTLQTSTSAPYALWTSVFDSLGNIYCDINRTVWIYNFKDSIIAAPLGNVFLDGQSLAYSMSLGRDNHIYFGGSSGGTFWSEYDPCTKLLTKHKAIDPNNDYVLSIMGDSAWVYAQVGQRYSNDIWAIRKSDDYKVRLFSIPNTTRFNVEVRRDAVAISFYTDTLAGNYLLKDGAAVRGMPRQPIIAYNEINGSESSRITSYFDINSLNYYYSMDGGAYRSIHVNATNERNNIRFMFFDRKDTTGFGYAGDYYGNWYWHSYTTDSSYLLGKTGFNVYSGMQFNDSIFYFGNYPSGALLQWNKNHAWTLQKFIKGKTVAAGDANANPKLVGYFKSETPAGFHHASAMQEDTVNGNIVCAGNVIRIGNTCSIGTYKIQNDSIYGYDFKKIDHLSLECMVKYGGQCIMSTNNLKGGVPKLYFYDVKTNSMTDSLDFGFNTYGKLYLKGDVLTGISSDHIYQVNLRNKQLLQQDFLTGYVFYSIMLSDGRIAVNTYKSMPKGYADFVYIPYEDCYVGGNYLYAILKGKTVVRVRESELKERNPALTAYPQAQKSNGGSIKVYPNPAGSTLNISFNDAKSQNSYYRVVDQSGRVAKSGAIAAEIKDMTINVQNLRRGFYWLVTGSGSAPFIKQ